MKEGWREGGRWGEQQAVERERGLLPEETSQLCLHVDVDWPLMVSEGRLHSKKENEKKNPASNLA